MTKLVIDVSVAVKWFIPEIHSEAAVRLLDSKFMISAPDLIVSEIGNTLWKKVRRQEITPEEASEILNTFPNAGVEIYACGPLLASALELAIALDRTVYDCLYLALAVAQNCALITADQRFHASVIESPLASHIRWIEDE